MRDVSAVRRRGRSNVTLLYTVATPVAVLALIAIGTLPAEFGIVAMLILTGGLYWLLRERIQHILLVFLGVFLALVVVGGPAPMFAVNKSPERLHRAWTERGRTDERLPAFVHLVFDEMMSPGAIDETPPIGRATRQALYDIGRRHGLRTYDSVYSRSYFSGVALPNLYNAEYRGKMSIADRFPKVALTGTAIPANAYFEEMRRRGYRTIAFQTSHLDFCANRNVDVCETFASFDPIVLGPGALDVRSQSLHMLNVLLRLYEPSYVSRYGRQLMNGDGAKEEAARRAGIPDRFDVQGFGTWFDRFLGFVERMPRGTHLFAHFMAPHSPYLLTEECTFGVSGGVGYNLAARFPDAASRHEARRNYESQYLAQLACVTNRLDAFLNAVARNPALQDATIVIHGDHGSRISGGSAVEDVQREDLIANYAAYFAVRSPGVSPGLDCEFLSLGEAFRHHAGGDRLGVVDRRKPPVLVQAKTGGDVLVEVPMPRFGCATVHGGEE